MNRFKGNIWFYAALYFAFYVPYAALTSAMTSGTWPSSQHLSGTSLLPLSSVASLVVMLGFLAVTGWWRHARRHGSGMPMPHSYTVWSGLCGAVILTTTTLAYAFEGTSIVFIMLLMRAGVLAIAPVVDLLTGRIPKWYSWGALGLSVVALVVIFLGRAGFGLTLAAGINLGIYLAAYFIRLRIMSKHAKSSDEQATKKYFVEEQLITAPVSLLAIVVLSLVGQGRLQADLQAGFALWQSELLMPVLFVGICSQMTGIFGTLTFLDPREHTFSVPVNRSASILAGLAAQLSLALLFARAWPSYAEVGGAALVVLAILLLTLGPRFSSEKV